MVSAVAFAAAPLRVQSHEAPASSELTPAMRLKLARSHKAANLNPALATKPVTGKHKTIIEEPEIILDELVVTPPEGTATIWSRYCYSYFAFFGGVYAMIDEGSCVNMVTTADGTVWIDNPISQFPVDTWVKGTLNEDGSVLTFSGAQFVYRDEYEDEVYDFYVCPVEYEEVDEDGGWFFPCDKVELIRQEDGSYKLEDELKMLGICDRYEGEWAWSGYADADAVLTKLDATCVEMPADVEATDWALISDDAVYKVKVGTTAEKVYIAGLMPGAQGCLVGDVDGDKVNFAGGQYIGADDLRYHTFVYGGEWTEIYDEYYEEDVPAVLCSGGISFNYDAEGKVLSDCPLIAFASSNDTSSDLYAVSALTDVKIEYQVREEGALPAAPCDIEVEDFDFDWGYADVYFTLPDTDVNGTLLDTENLYYCVYIDGELFTFYTDEYYEIPEDMTEIPYNFTDYWDFSYSGNAHAFSYYMTGFETLGIQSIYVENGVKLYSEITTVNVGNEGNADTALAKTVESVSYYDLQGRKVADPSAGLYIRRTVYTDGTSAVSKMRVNK